MTSGMIDAAKNSALNGTSVRTLRYASPVPITSDTAAAPTANHSEFPTRLKIWSLPYARAKPEKVNPDASKKVPQNQVVQRHDRQVGDDQGHHPEGQELRGR